jgi:serine/threonine-protein kinase
MKLDPPIDLDRWQKVEAILDQALELPAEEQSRFLDQACAADPGLRSEVEALLSADEAASGFLKVPAGEYAPELLDEEAEDEDLTGHQVGPYRLLREIGNGGMGMVYEAEDARLGRRVAVKLLPPEVNRDRKAKERFLREAKAAAAVDHPNICTVHDVGESDGRLYIVLTYYEGETLRERIKRGPLPLDEARQIAIQVSRGLACAHEAGIVHRDIKPANVMLPRRGEAKILDFGIARLQGDDASLTRTGASWGTPAYMSPEQARGEPVDARTDVWSLGAMLYEMIAGRRPFGGESLEAVVSAILTQEPEPLERIRPDVPEDLARIVERALIKNPAERYADAGELLADLETESVPVRRVWRKRFRTRLLAGALALSVLTLALWWWHGRTVVGPTIKVAVLQPLLKAEGNDPELAFVSSDVVQAALSTLINLEGVQALDPPEKEEETGSDLERLRSGEANEVLRPLLDCRESWCRVTLRRLRKPGGVVLATADSFDVQVGTEKALQLADGVRGALLRLYSGHPPRPGALTEVRPEDYSSYIKLERRADRGERLGNGEIGQLDDLLKTSPGLLGAYLLAADIARRQGEPDRARVYAVRAQELSPKDPAPLFNRFRVELEGNQLNAARAILAQLTDLAPSDARVESAKADLLEAEGKLKEAHGLQESVARRRPTWRHTLDLVTLEFRLGEVVDARRRIADLLRAQPDNQTVLQNLAVLEAGFGDLKRAAALFEKLIRIRPTRLDLTNLGFIRYLLGDFAAASRAYRQALGLEPTYFLTRFNLATALEAKGDLSEARRLYRALEKELSATPAQLDARTRMLHAQCLVRLGQKEEAARLAEEVLAQRPEDFQVIQQAAQIYALLGERLEALVYIERSLKKGVRREWFTTPEFRSLQEDPELRALLDRYTTQKTEGH